MTEFIAPVLHLDKRGKWALRRLVGRIVENAAVKRNGEDILTTIYLTGLYHGATLGVSKEPPP